MRGLPALPGALPVLGRGRRFPKICQVEEMRVKHGLIVQRAIGKWIIFKLFATLCPLTPRDYKDI